MKASRHEQYEKFRHLNGTSLLGKLYNVIVIESRMPCKLKNKKSANQLTAYLCAYEAENCIANVWRFVKETREEEKNNDKTIKSNEKHHNSNDGMFCEL